MKAGLGVRFFAGAAFLAGAFAAAFLAGAALDAGVFFAVAMVKIPLIGSGFNADEQFVFS
jgi:hypothetical protein